LAQHLSLEMPLRITFLVPGRGLVGGVKVMGEYAGRLRARGHEVAVLYRRPADAVQRLVRWWANRRTPDALDDSGCPVTGVAAFSAETVPDGDVLVANGLDTIAEAADLPPAKGRLVALVQSVVDLEAEPARARRVLARPAHRVAVSDSVARYLCEHLGAEAEVVPNGVDHGQFYATDRRLRQPRTVGMMVAPGPEKGVEDGFEAVRLVRDQWPDVRLVLFGARKPRRKPPRADVFVRPKTSRLRAIYSSCEIWLAPSHSEGFGLPVLEAMACQAVPVATRAGGHECIIEDEVSGFLVPVGDTQAMAKRIGLLIDDESLLRKMSEAAHARSLLFDWETSTDRLETLLRQWTEEQRADVSNAG